MSLIRGKNYSDVCSKSTSILDIPLHQLTPGMRQYQDAKKQNPDCIIFLRMGDFYEMFYEDAVTVSRELEITLTSRGKGEKKAPLAGIPYHALDNYLGRLVKKGFKVAIIEQLEDPKQAKGLVKRGLVRIVTPGTMMESSVLEEGSNNYVGALTQFNDDFKLALCDLTTGEFFTLSATGEENAIHEIKRYNPAEFLIPESLGVNINLINEIKDCSFVNFISDSNFKQDNSLSFLKEYFKIDSFGLPNENIGVVGGLFRYLVDTQKTSLTHIKRISLRGGGHLILDSVTLKNLELLRSLNNNKRKGSLLDVIDQTTTAMGSRLIQKWLKLPLTDLAKINYRLDGVDELKHALILREEVKDLLKDVQDIERLIAKVNFGNAMPKDLLSLRNSLKLIAELPGKLNNCSTEILQKVSKLPDLSKEIKIIDDSIKEEPANHLREGGIIKSEFNEELNELHNITKNSKSFIKDLEQKERQKTGISSLRIGYNRVFGYYLEITKKNLSLVPEHYIRKQTLANAERFLTSELKEAEEKILTAQEKINKLEYKIYQDIVDKLKTKTSEIQQTSMITATLDVLNSFASIAAEKNYCRPEFCDESIINIEQGRHPVLEKIMGSFIPNDVLMQQGEMMIITGPNTSGKSTVMRQTALIFVMAQMGCFVPAVSCKIGITDRIFTRVGASDDLTSGNSTFMVEMLETASILNNATSRSLLILDEIGRGTSTFDGVSIAWSVVEHIYQNIKARCMFSTHYHVMNKLGEKFSKITNYNLLVKEQHGELVFLRKLVPGGTDQSHGIYVAKLAGIPNSVVERAKEIQQILEKDDEMVRRMKAKKLQEQKSLEEY